MSSFASARRRIEQCRICLERDASSGVIPAPAQDEVDRCYLAVATILDEARVEIEAAGPRLHRDEEFREQFVGRCLLLARWMFRAMYTEACPLTLSRIAVRLRARTCGLKKYLWVRLERAA